MSEQENKIICAHIVGDAIISPAYLNIDSARFWRIEGGRPESVVVLRRRIDEGLTARDVCSVEFLETIMDLNKNMHYKQSQIELTMISQDFWAIKIHFKEKIQAMISYAHAGAYMAQKDKDFYRDSPSFLPIPSNIELSPYTSNINFFKSSFQLICL